MYSRFVLAALLLPALLNACSEQGEGERCDTNNGDYDCEPGLQCKSEAQLDIDGRGVALCCPREDVAPTVDACRAGAVQLPDEPDAGGDGG